MKGIVPSLNTPFDDDGDVDFASLCRLIDHTVESGCSGMLGLAVAGEHTTLTFSEKRRFIDVTVEVTANRIPFLVSVTATDPDTSVALASVAVSAGAAGICVQLPDGADRIEKREFLRDLQDVGPATIMVQDLDWTGDGLPLDEIVYLFEEVEKFSWLKIETRNAGPKYSSVLEATDSALYVCGGWAVSQLMDALARGVTAFIPTGMERLYVAIQDFHTAGNTAAARALFERMLPVLNFSNQNIDISIRFFKELRKAEGLFETSACRTPSAVFDPIQQREAAHAIEVALTLIDQYSPQNSTRPTSRQSG